jgi:hypothetical protein
METALVQIDEKTALEAFTAGNGLDDVIQQAHRKALIGALA